MALLLFQSFAAANVKDGEQEKSHHSNQEKRIQHVLLPR